MHNGLHSFSMLHLFKSLGMHYDHSTRILSLRSIILQLTNIWQGFWSSIAVVVDSCKALDTIGKYTASLVEMKRIISILVKKYVPHNFNIKEANLVNQKNHLILVL